jgi:hypothetical protein
MPVGVPIMAAPDYGPDRLFGALEHRVVHRAGKE